MVNEVTCIVCLESLAKKEAELADDARREMELHTAEQGYFSRRIHELKLKGQDNGK